MKLEKRSADVQPSSQPAANQHGHKGRSHILIYILILFIAAFLLMALSFLSHQRSNEQVLGQLSSNVSNLEKLQSALEENIRLQEQVNAQQIQLESLKYDLDAASSAQAELAKKITGLESAAAQQQKELDVLRQNAAAMSALTQLQQLLISGDLDAARQAIANLEASGLDKSLPTAADTTGGISPYQMFQNAKLLTAVPAEDNVSRETSSQSP